MIIYKATKKQFVDDVFNDVIADNIDNAFYEHLGRHTSRNEVRSWKNSMQYMYRVVNTSTLPDDVGIAIEYQIPLTCMRVDFILTVDADAVPSGEKIRCWLPFPRTDIARQTDVKLLYTSEKNYKVAPSKFKHSSVYMEKKAQAGKPTVFKETFEYVSYGAWFNLKPENIKPYPQKNISVFDDLRKQQNKSLLTAFCCVLVFILLISLKRHTSALYCVIRQIIQDPEKAKTT